MTAGQAAAGFAVANITPSQSLPLAGISGERFGTKKMDDLKVRAIAVTHGDNTLILVSLDVLYVSREFCDQLGVWLEGTCGVAAENLMVAATHTHCAPLLLDRYFENFPADQKFADLSIAGAKLAVCTAIESQSEATIEFSSSLADVSVNRRARRLDRVAMRDFRLRWAVANRPNWQGPVDNTVRTIRFRMRSADRKDIVIVSAGCHPSIIRENVYTADFPGLIEGQLNESDGRPSHILFVQGFSGDTRPRLVESAPPALWPPGPGFDWLFDRERFRKNSLQSDARWVAETLAKSIVEARAGPISDLRLSARRIDVPLALDENVDLRELQEIAESEEEPEWRRRYARYARSAYADRSVVAIRIQRWSLGPGLCIVGLEGEIFSAYGGWMSRTWGKQGVSAVPAGCVGGMVGYIPTASALEAGGYEVDRSRTMFGLPGRFAPSVEHALKDGIQNVFSDKTR